MRANAIFIGIEVADDVAGDPAVAAKLEETCPVDIYADVDASHVFDYVRGSKLTTTGC